MTFFYRFCKWTIAGFKTYLCPNSACMREKSQNSGPKIIHVHFESLSVGHDDFAHVPPDSLHTDRLFEVGRFPLIRLGETSQSQACGPGVLFLLDDAARCGPAHRWRCWRMRTWRPAHHTAPRASFWYPFATAHRPSDGECSSHRSGERFFFSIHAAT